MPGEWEDVGPALDQPRNAPPGPLPKGGEKGLATRVSYSPDEQARVQAQEAELQDSNLQSITRELANPKLGAKQRAVLEEEQANLQAKPKAPAGDGWEDIGAVTQPKGPGPEKKKTVLDITSSTDAKDHLLNLWRNESMVGHMYNAYQKGVFEKSMKDLVKSVPEQVKDFSLPELWNSAKEDPRQFAGVLIDSLVADPYLLLAPAGLGGRLAFRLGTLGAKAGKAAEVAAKVAGRGAEGAVAGAALMTPISIAEQLDKNGYVDPRQVGEDMKMGAVTAGVLTAGIHLGADIKGVKPNEVYAKVKKGVSEDNLAPVEALQKAFDDFGIPAEKSGPIVEEVASHENFDKANAMYSEQVAKGLNPEPPVRQDVVSRQKEVAALLKAKTTFEAQAPAAEAQRAQPVATTLEQPTPARVNEQFNRGEVLGAPAALAKDAAERTEADWVALRAQAKLQDAKASDGGKVAIPELSKDTNLGQQIVGRELPNVVKAKAALELPEQVRTVDDLAAIEAENMKVKGPYTPLTQFWPMVGVGTVAAGVGYAFDPNWERDLAMGAGAVLAVKAKGGMWHPEAIERLAKPLQDKIHRIEDLNIEMNIPAGSPSKVVEMKDAWTFKAVKNYLNKHAGTESDPLKDMEIPLGPGVGRWEDAMDAVIRGRESKQYPGQSEFHLDRGAPGNAGGEDLRAITSYLSHVGDYLREFVPSEKLGQYDLVRAVKETAAQDIKQAKKMAEARASGAGTTVFKEYPDGMKWVEVGKGSSKDVNEAALKNEGDVMGHCVGGYCEAVHEGSSKIYSLRDAKGESHVTIEVAPKPARDWDAKGESIVQIKGKQNRAPVAAYLPYVQDFVKSGKWGEVGDLQNAGLIKGSDISENILHRHLKVTGEELRAKGLDPKSYYTDTEIEALANKVRRSERGSIDPEFARYLALGAAGALVGSYLADDKVTGTLLGAALAAGGLPLLRAATRIVDKAGETLVKLATGPRDTRYRIDGMINDYQEGVARGGISAMRAVEAFKQLVPQIERRNELTHFIQTGGDKGPRTAAEQEYVRLQVHGYKGILENEKRAGVIEQGIEDGTYVAQYWSGGKDEILKAQRIFSAMSQKNPNAMQRVIPDYQTGMNAGLTPKTLDSAEIMGIRMRSSATVIERQKFMERLKEGRTPTNEKLIVPLNDSKAAVGYEQIKHPALLAYRVHPDIAPSLRTLYSALEPHAILDALNLVSSASKRMIFAISQFHAISLTMALLARPKALFKLKEAHNAWMNGTNDQLLYRAIAEGGVKIDPKRGVDMDYDLLQRAMGRMIDSSAGLASKGRAGLAAGGAAVGFYASNYEPGGALLGAALAFGGGRKGLQGAKVLDDYMRRFLWDYIHPVYKIATFAAEDEAALKVNAARVAKGEAGKPLKQIAREVGGSVNDFFGGQNWAANAEVIQNKFGRNLALALAQPDSQRLMQIALQAPDWLVSTLKSITKALPGVADKDVAKVHRAYILNSMLMYATIGDALNVYFSGHHFWENKDWTRIDLGDGRTMQTNKHFMEFFHWLADPAQVFYNKLAFWPSEVLEQANNQKWLTSGEKKPAPPIRKPGDTTLSKTGDSLAHVAKRFWPISGSQDSVEKTIAGFMGMPIYGETDTARAARMERQKEQRNTPEARELRRTKRELKREKENR